MKISVRNGKAADGMSHGDIDQFLVDMLASLVREQAQNSGDASTKANVAKKKPVQLDFTLKTIKTSEIPDVKRFKNIIDLCEDMSLEGRDKREQEFLASAKKVIAQKEIRVLSISDFNTTGVGGDFDAGGAFYTLAKATGVTSKDNVHSGGSFGIGKMSAFAASKLRTVFYSSMFEENGKPSFYCMGRSFLRSWREDNEYKEREFFWGVGKNNDQAETDPEKVPDWLQRDKVGLSTHIVALQDEFDAEWENELFATLLKNFYAAINDGIIEFTINGGKQVLNSQNIGVTFERVAEARKDIDDSEFEAAQTFMQVISGASEKREFHVEGIGDLKLEVATKNVPNIKRVQIIRNGMVITDNLKGFKDELRKFQGLKPFAAVLRPARIKSEASAWIKSLEGPQHNALTTSYLNDPDAKEESKRLMFEVTRQVRLILKEIASSASGETKQLSEIDKYITSKPTELDGSGEEEKDPVKVNTKIRMKNHKSNQNGYQPGGNKGRKATGEGRNRRKTTNEGEKGGRGKGKFESIKLEARAVKIDSSKPLLRRIVVDNMPLSGDVDIGVLKIARTGAEELVPATLKSDFDAKVIGGSFRFKAEAGDSVDFLAEVKEDVSALHAVVTITEPKKTLVQKLRGK